MQDFHCVSYCNQMYNIHNVTITHTPQKTTKKPTKKPQQQQQKTNKQNKQTKTSWHSQLRYREWTP